MTLKCIVECFFFFNDTATTEIYTLSLHDALPIWPRPDRCPARRGEGRQVRIAGCFCRRPKLLRRRAEALPLGARRRRRPLLDRKSTRLNSSHANISYAVFCLKKKKATFFKIEYSK